MKTRRSSRLGILGFASNSGLGTLTWEFARHLKPERVLLIKTSYAEFPDRFPGSRRGTDRENVDWLLGGIDVLLMFETPKDWDIIRLAKKADVKTILMPMYECMPKDWPALPDLILCPSLIDLRIFREQYGRATKVEYLPVPVNRALIPFRRRRRARVFEHHAGHGGLLGRNGTHELLAAAPMLRSKAKILIFSQRELDYAHPNVEIRVGNFKTYADLWGQGDVFVFPHKFDGLSLPVQEALASGMPVLSTDIEAVHGWLPDQWLIPAHETTEMRVFQRMCDVAVVDPADIARKIDEWYDRDIEKESGRANALAAKLDWKVLREEYRQMINKL